MKFPGDEAMTGVCAGDIHSVAWNDESVFIWGLYRNVTGPIGEKFTTPHKVNFGKNFQHQKI